MNVPNGMFSGASGRNPSTRNHAGRWLASGIWAGTVALLTACGGVESAPPDLTNCAGPSTWILIGAAVMLLGVGVVLGAVMFGEKQDITNYHAERPPK